MKKSLLDFFWRSQSVQIPSINSVGVTNITATSFDLTVNFNQPAIEVWGLFVDVGDPTPTKQQILNGDSPYGSLYYDNTIESNTIIVGTLNELATQSYDVYIFGLNGSYSGSIYKFSVTLE